MLQTIDAYEDILHIHQAKDKNILKESYLMSAYIWDFKISNNIDALETFLYNPLLKVFGKYDMIFFPIRHGFEDHYTLTLLDTIEGKWYHYNPRLSKNGNLHTPCFNDVVQLSKMVMEFLKHHKKVQDMHFLRELLSRVYSTLIVFDCGVLVLYYMEHMSKMWLIMENFNEDELLEYKATCVGAFLNDESNLNGRIHRPPTYSQGYLNIQN
ncbi:hypothetical protein DVH24_039121 [Malus domestica]|uniref:Ubiquitin-like protease family profile domain-containing protein n=1 Tax=Malus domestica TaxID=3750 RepID=A0A498KBV3_MALDO|nr:hypothetical protein DVH24_039121 [Malus domestica]